MKNESTEYPRSAGLGQFTARLFWPELTALRGYAFANVSVEVLRDTRYRLPDRRLVCLFRRWQNSRGGRMNDPGNNECQGAYPHDL